MAGCGNTTSAGTPQKALPAAAATPRTHPGITVLLPLFLNSEFEAWFLFSCSDLFERHWWREEERPFIHQFTTQMITTAHAVQAFNIDLHCHLKHFPKYVTKTDPHL